MDILYSHQKIMRTTGKPCFVTHVVIQLSQLSKKELFQAAKKLLMWSWSAPWQCGKTQQTKSYLQLAIWFFDVEKPLKK